MATVYKLTDQKGYTRRGKKNECLWGVGVSHTAKGAGGLCTDGVIHAYSNPIIAAVCNQQHGEMDVTHHDSWKKLGGKSLLITEEISMPTQWQLTLFAILSARKAFEILAQSPNSFFKQKTSRAELAREKLKEWEDWADLYIAGKSTTDAAYAAADAAAYAADAARAAYAAKIDFVSIAEEAMSLGE